MANADVTARTQLEAQLIDRALTDPAFRAALMADPKAVFARELGLEMPDTITVEVLEESPTTVYLVLPHAVAAAGAELSDAELDTVAGGWSGATNCGSCGETTCGPNTSPCGCIS